MPAKRTEPSRSALDQRGGFKYVDALHTDLAKRFKQIAADRKKEARLAKETEFKARQIPMELDAAQVLPIRRAAAGGA